MLGGTGEMLQLIERDECLQQGRWKYWLSWIDLEIR